jgi:hypothetical protein
MRALSKLFTVIAAVSMMATVACGANGDAGGTAAGGIGGSSKGTAPPDKAHPTASFVPVTDDLYVEVSSSDAGKLDECVAANGPLKPGGYCSDAIPAEGWFPGKCPLWKICISIIASPVLNSKATIKLTDNRPKKSICADTGSVLCRGMAITREDAAVVANQQAGAASPQASDESHPVRTDDSSTGPTPSATPRQTTGPEPTIGETTTGHDDG